MLMGKGAGVDKFNKGYDPSCLTSLYGTPSYARLQAEGLDPGPGPGSYERVVGVGPQVESTKPSAPSVSMIGKNTKSWAKTWISKHHLQV
jgi:hypothetical protein